MTAPRHDGSLLYMCERAWLEAGTSGKVQSARDPQLGCVGRERGEGKGNRGSQVQQPGDSKIQRKWVIKMVGLQRDKKPRPLGYRHSGQGVGYASQEGSVTSRD